jgi:response regulator RpfG family c-di-GMP phosphodiesterase
LTYKILIVDDEMPNLRLLERLFRRDYYCLTASSGAEAIELLQQHDVAIVITDQRMPQMTGMELLKRTSEMRPHMVRILLTGYTDVETLVEAINCGLVYMYVNKPWNNDDLKVKVSRAIEHYENNRKQNSLVISNQRLVVRLKEMKVGFIRVLAEALKSKDDYIYKHGSRVSRNASLVAQGMGLNEEACTELRVAALLHHIGIISTSDRAPLKIGPVTGDDPKAAQEHSERGAQILSGVPELGDVADVIRFHQENFDGTGSRHLIGEQIPLSSRILRVVDAYDLMTNPRNADMSLSPREGIGTLKERSGREFDPKVVQELSEIVAREASSPRDLGGRALTANPLTRAWG